MQEDSKEKGNVTNVNNMTVYGKHNALRSTGENTSLKCFGCGKAQESTHTHSLCTCVHMLSGIGRSPVSALLFSVKFELGHHKRRRLRCFQRENKV